MEIKLAFEKYAYRKICELEEEEKAVRRFLERREQYNLELLEWIEFNSRRETVLGMLEEFRNLLLMSDTEPE